MVAVHKFLRLGDIIVILVGALALNLQVAIFPAFAQRNSKASETHDERLLLIHPESPRGVTGKTFQYTGLGTPLGGRHFISDVITQSTRWQLWNGLPAEPFDVAEQTPENYDSAHNHYQLSPTVSTDRKANKTVNSKQCSARRTPWFLSYGGFMVSDQSQAMMGIDYRKTLFTQGAGLFRFEGVGTGLIFNEGKGGEIYAGNRWPGQKTDDWLMKEIFHAKKRFYLFRIQIASE